jgi:hypothetical protein
MPSATSWLLDEVETAITAAIAIAATIEPTSQKILLDDASLFFVFIFSPVEEV